MEPAAEADAVQVDTCPICRQEMEDRRHVGVECFYAVDEVAPDTTKDTVLRPVPDDASIWGITRRYPAGTVDKHVVTGVTTSEAGYKTTHVGTVQEPIPPIRVVELTIYSMECCKSCRADFLRMFGRWTKGALVHREEDDPEADIPIRENGAIRLITREEWDRRRANENGGE